MILVAWLRVEEDNTEHCKDEAYVGIRVEELSDQLVSGEMEKKESRNTGNCAFSTWMH